MKAYQNVIIPAEPERLGTRITALLCDLCGKTVKQFLPDGRIVLNPIMRQRYGDAAEVLVSLRAGERNLDGGVGQTTSFDVCPKCFEKRLQPWLEQQGAEPQIERWSH